MAALPCRNKRKSAKEKALFDLFRFLRQNKGYTFGPFRCSSGRAAESKGKWRLFLAETSERVRKKRLFSASFVFCGKTPVTFSALSAVHQAEPPKVRANGGSSLPKQAKECERKGSFRPLSFFAAKHRLHFRPFPLFIRPSRRK